MGRIGANPQIPKSPIGPSECRWPPNSVVPNGGLKDLGGLLNNAKIDGNTNSNTNTSIDTATFNNRNSNTHGHTN